MVGTVNVQALRDAQSDRAARVTTDVNNRRPHMSIRRETVWFLLRAANADPGVRHHAPRPVTPSSSAYASAY